MLRRILRLLSRDNANRLGVFLPRSNLLTASVAACGHLLAAAGSLTHGSAVAAENATNEVDVVREEMQQLQRDYQRRMQELDMRLQRLEHSDPGPDPQQPGAVTPPGTPDSINDLQRARAFAREQFIDPTEEYETVLSLAFEGGVDWTKFEETGVSGHLYKLTLAPQVQLDNTWFSRPSIRAFVTYAAWSPEYRGQVGGLDYVDETQGWTYGIHMEVWW